MTLRYASQLYHRARAVSPQDVLTSKLADALRAWPLSGVLSDIDDPPTSPLDFDDHEGLLLLYAERFVEHPRPAWKPAGRGAEYLEVVQSLEQASEGRRFIEAQYIPPRRSHTGERGR